MGFKPPPNRGQSYPFDARGRSWSRPNLSLRSIEDGVTVAEDSSTLLSLINYR